MIGINRFVKGVVLAAATIALGGHGLQAQGISVSAAAEAAGDDVYVLFSELGWAAAGRGIRPVASLGGYLVFTEGDDSWGVTPAGGLRYATSSGFIQGQVGWAFREESGTPFFGGGDSGFHTSLHTEFWGDVFSAQGIASYNWGGDYLWSRGRVARRMGTLANGGSWGLGAELVYQAEAEERLPGVDGFSATQIGPVLQWTPREGGPSMAFGGGWKRTEFGDTSDSSWYLRGEIYIP